MWQLRAKCKTALAYSIVNFKFHLRTLPSYLMYFATADVMRKPSGNSNTRINHYFSTALLIPSYRSWFCTYKIKNQIISWNNAESTRLQLAKCFFMLVNSLWLTMCRIDVNSIKKI